MPKTIPKHTKTCFFERGTSKNPSTHLWVETFFSPTPGGRVHPPPYPPPCWTPPQPDSKKHVKTHTNRKNNRFASTLEPTPTPFGIISRIFLVFYGVFL